MADFTVKQGTTWRLNITVVDSLGAPIDISEAVIRFSMKRNPDDLNSEGIFLQSYDSEEIAITDGPNGKFTVVVLPHMTEGIDTGTWYFANEIARKRAGAQTTGLADVTGGSPTFTISTGDITEINNRQIVEFSAGANPNVRVLVTAVTQSPDTVTCGFDGLATDAAQAYSAYNADIDIPDSVCGTVEVKPNPVK